MVSVTQGQKSAFSKADNHFFREMAKPGPRARYEAWVTQQAEAYEAALELEEYNRECEEDFQLGNEIWDEEDVCTL
jgi:hypothetical protein